MDNKGHSAIRFLKFIFYVIISILSAILILTWYWVSVYGPFMAMDIQSQATMKALIIIFALAGIPLSFKFHQTKLNHLNKTVSDINQRIVHYRSIVLIKYAMLEALAFVALFGYLLSGDLSFLLIGFILVVTLGINYPSIHKMEEELELFDNNELE